MQKNRIFWPCGFFGQNNLGENDFSEQEKSLAKSAAELKKDT